MADQVEKHNIRKSEKLDEPAIWEGKILPHLILNIKTCYVSFLQ